MSGYHSRAVALGVLSMQDASLASLVHRLCGRRRWESDSTVDLKAPKLADDVLANTGKRLMSGRLPTKGLDLGVEAAGEGACATSSVVGLKGCQEIPRSAQRGCMQARRAAF